MPQFICPVPMSWDEAYQSLRQAWEKGGKQGAPPPRPLNLNGWVASSDLDKKKRWEATIRWAQRQGFGPPIPEMSEEERYEAELTNKRWELTDE